MRKMRKKKYGYVIVAFIVCAVLAGCSKDYFDGSRTRNPDAYLLTFSYMNQKDEYTLELAGGDILCVEYEIEKGDIDVTIGIEGEEPVYRGDDIATGTFELLIEETGNYTIAVDARRAAGTMNFTVLQAEQTEEITRESEQTEISTWEQEESDVSEEQTNVSEASALKLPALDEINQNVTIGTAGSYRTVVQAAVRLLDWGVGTGLDPEEIREATVVWLMNKGNDEQVEFAKKLRKVDEVYHKLLSDNAEELLKSAECETDAYPWSDAPVESIEVIMDTVGLRPYEETEEKMEIEETDPQTDDWKSTFEESLYSNYQVTVDHYEDLGDGVYQVYVIIEGKEVPYVTVDSKTGDYHG